LREWYGFAIGAAFSGVVGVLLSNYGNRVCVVSAPWPPYWDYNNVYYQNLDYTNGGQYFCGNCSTYCEMGIDVRSYAEKEKTLFVPPVGCGICAALP
jgi:hypothetical protein